VDGTEFRGYERRSHTYFRGAATPENLRAVLRVPLPPDMFVRVLMGRALAVEPEGPPTWRRDGDLDLLTIADAEGRTAYVWTRRGGIRPEKTHLVGAGGELLVRAVYRSWVAPEDATPLPGALTLAFPPVETSLELELGEAEHNPDLPPGLFRLRRPAGSRLLDLDATLSRALP